MDGFDKLYDESATLGRWSTLIGKIIFAIVGATLIFKGLLLVYRKKENQLTKGLTLILIGTLTIALGFLADRLARKNQFFAASQGVDTVARLF